MTTATRRMKNVLLLSCCCCGCRCCLCCLQRLPQRSILYPLLIFSYFSRILSIFRFFHPMYFWRQFKKCRRAFFGNPQGELPCCSLCSFDSFVFPCTITKRTVKNNKIAYVTTVYHLFLCPAIQGSKSTQFLPQ